MKRQNYRFFLALVAGLMVVPPSAAAWSMPAFTQNKKVTQTSKHVAGHLGLLLAANALQVAMNAYYENQSKGLDTRSLPEALKDSWNAVLSPAAWSEHGAQIGKIFKKQVIKDQFGDGIRSASNELLDVGGMKLALGDYKLWSFLTALQLGFVAYSGVSLKKIFKTENARIAAEAAQQLAAQQLAAKNARIVEARKKAALRRIGTHVKGAAEQLAAERVEAVRLEAVRSSLIERYAALYRTPADCDFTEMTDAQLMDAIRSRNLVRFNRPSPQQGAKNLLISTLHGRGYSRDSLESMSQAELTDLFNSGVPAPLAAPRVPVLGAGASAGSGSTAPTATEVLPPSLLVDLVAIESQLSESPTAIFGVPNPKYPSAQAIEQIKTHLSRELTERFELPLTEISGKSNNDLVKLLKLKRSELEQISNGLKSLGCTDVDLLTPVQALERLVAIAKVVADKKKAARLKVEQQKAAVKIQAFARKNAAQRAFEATKKQIVNAQAVVRGWFGKKEAKKLIEKKEKVAALLDGFPSLDNDLSLLKADLALLSAELKPLNQFIDGVPFGCTDDQINAQVARQTRLRNALEHKIAEYNQVIAQKFEIVATPGMTQFQALFRGKKTRDQLAAQKVEAEAERLAAENAVRISADEVKFSIGELQSYSNSGPLVAKSLRVIEVNSSPNIKNLPEGEFLCYSKDFSRFWLVKKTKNSWKSSECLHGSFNDFDKLKDYIREIIQAESVEVVVEPQASAPVLGAGAGAGSSAEQSTVPARVLSSPEVQPDGTLVFDRLPKPEEVAELSDGKRVSIGEFEVAGIAAEAALQEATAREVRRQEKADAEAKAAVRARAIRLGNSTFEAGFDSYVELTKGMNLPPASDVDTKNLLYVVRPDGVFEWKNNRWQTLSKADVLLARARLSGLKKVK